METELFNRIPWSSNAPCRDISVVSFFPAPSTGKFLAPASPALWMDTWEQPRYTKENQP